MLCAARVHDSARIGQRLKQRPRATCVVQVHVGEKDKVDGGARDAELLERRN